MTRALLAAVAGASGATTTRLVVATLVLAILPLAIVFDGARHLAWWWRVRAVLGVDETRCPRGHRVPLAGAWQCSGCGAVFESHGFADCPLCATRSNVTCACGLTVLNPLGAGGPG